MKKIKLMIFATCLLVWWVSFMAQAQQMCGTEILHEKRMLNDADYAKQHNLINKQIRDLEIQKQSNGQMKISNLNVVYNIPVVVHVVHLGEPLGTGSNVSDASIFAMIADLNTRYANGNGNGVDMGVTFCLASRDPNGISTTGITRHNGSGIPGYAANGVGFYQPSSCGGIDDAPVKNLSDWSCASYYNIWIVSDICDADGYANPPFTVQPHDGMVIRAGSMTNGQLFAHETGHWLSLMHTFLGANGTTCPANTTCASQGDYVCDTPPVVVSDCNSLSCPNPGGYPITNSTHNYMGYCFQFWDRFTAGQKDRVVSSLTVTIRNLLASSLGCVAVGSDAGLSAMIQPRDTSFNSTCGVPHTVAPIVTLTNSGSSTLTLVTIKSKLDNTVTSYTWTGSLATNATVNVTLPTITVPVGTHTYRAYTDLPNGVADIYHINDSSKVVNFNITGPPPVTLTSASTQNTCGGSVGTATVNATGGTGAITSFNENFEGANTWTILNGTEANKWHVGAATAASGTKSIYVSNDNGVTNTYGTPNSFSNFVHFYKNFTFPAGANNIKVQFQWKCEGEVFQGGAVYDYMKVYLIPTTNPPVAATLLINGGITPAIGGNGLSYTTQTITGLDTVAGSTRSLVFSWISDNAQYGQPPASVDNISVSYLASVTYTYLWSNGQTGQTASGLVTGTYTVTVTDPVGCSSTKSVTVTDNCTSVAISAGGATTFCQGGSVQLTSSLPSGNVWSTGATTQSITISASGSYSCTNAGNTSNTIVVTVNPIPTTPTISNSGALTFCLGGSVTLTSSSATGNLWSTGATTQSISATTSGNYVVTVTSNGCTSSPSVAKVVTVNPTPATPTISNSGATTFCQGGSVTLTSSSATGNLWSTGATTQSISATASGNYIVTVTSNGCTSLPSLAKVVTVNPIPATATITAGGPTTFCTGGSVTLTSSSASGNLWSTGATTQSISATTSGNYVVTVTSNGCTSSPSIAKTVTVQACSISISAGGPTTFCQGGNVLLTSSQPTGNLWSTGATTQSITVSTSGSFSCTYNANTSNTIIVTVNPIPATPTISAGGPTTFCTGGSVTLTSSLASGNLWSTGATTQSISATTSGNYTVKVTSSGCTSSPSSATTVTVQSCSFSISAGGPTTFCQGGSVVLTSSQANGNLWSNGATTQSITVNTSGSYSCTYNGNASNTIVVTVNPLPNAAINSSNGLTFCNDNSSILSVPTPGGTTQTWTKNGVFYATAPNPIVSESGVYEVTVTTTATGCTATSSVTVTVNPIPSTPTISAGGPITFCQGGSVTLTSSSASGNLWSTGATTQSISATTSGNYTVAVTIGGCTSSPSAATTVIVQTCGSFSITAGGPTTFCQGVNVVLTSTLPTGNIWSNGATSQSITVSASGNYSCTNGANTSNTITVTVNPIASTATSLTGTVTMCSGGLINGPVTGNAANLDGVDDYISIANNVSAATAFTFEAWIYPRTNSNWMRVFDFGNGPGVNMFFAAPSFNGFPRFVINTGSSEQIVESNMALTLNAWNHIAVTISGTTAKIYIDGLVTGTNTNFTYNPTSLGATSNNWIGRSQYADPYFNGYIDEVRFWNTARTQSQLQVNMNKTISPSTSGLGAYYRLDETGGTSVIESVSGTSTGAAVNGATWQIPSTVPWNVGTYLWSTGATTKGFNVTSLGTYTLTVTANSGCTAVSAPVVVSVLKPSADAAITANGPTTFCPGGSVQLSAPSSGNALQFDGVDDYVTTGTPIIPVSGNYSILFWAKENVNQSGFREVVSQGRKFYFGKDNNGIIRVGDDWTNTGVNWPGDLQWHHYAVVRSLVNTYLYVDGNLAATKGSVIGSPIVVGGVLNNLIIGNQFNGVNNENFNGQVDDITIWSNQRTEAQIKTAMNSSVSSAASGLVAYYKLDEGTGTSTVNAVNNGNAGVLTNGPTWMVPSSLPYNISSYIWSTGASTQQITANAKLTYKVTVTNNYGCSTSASKKVIISTPGASFTASGSLTLCGGSTVTFTANTGAGNTYQWTKDGTNIGGATNQVYVANSAGTYKVIVTNSIGCTKISSGKVVTACARFGEVAEESAYNLSIYPNPTIDFITVSFDCEDEIADVQMVNEMGSIVKKKQLTSDEGIYEESLDVSNFAPGIYMILVQTQHGISTKRFVKR